MQATTTTPLFAARLTPHRSLAARNWWLVAALGVLLVTLPSLALVAIDPLVVVILMSIDIVAIALALLLSLRRGKQEEVITVWSDQMEWLTTDVGGAKTLRRFDPRTVRLVLERDADERTTAIRLRANGEQVEIATILRIEEKASLAKALGTALRKARG
jgi:uncharacterized membrane protein